MSYDFEKCWGKKLIDLMKISDYPLWVFNGEEWMNSCNKCCEDCEDKCEFSCEMFKVSPCGRCSLCDSKKLADLIKKK